MAIEVSEEEERVATAVGDLTAADVRELAQRSVSRLTLMTPFWSGVGLAELGRVGHLQKLRIVCYEPADLSGMPEALAVDELRIAGAPSGVLPLQRLAGLRALALQLGKGHRLKLSGLGQLSQLKAFEGGVGQAFAEEIGALPQLESLDLKRWRCSDLASLSGLKHLKCLRLEGFSSLSNIEVLGTWRELEFLQLLGARRVADYAPLAALHELRVLLLDDCAPLASLDVIDGAHHLHTLSLAGDTVVTDGRMSMLKRRDDLRFVNYVDRAHYDCPSADFPMNVSVFGATCNHHQPHIA